MDNQKTIISGIPFQRIVEYFESISAEKELSCTKVGQAYRFENRKICIEITPNLDPPVIRLVVPMTDITFTGTGAEVDAFMAAYRMAFLSAGG